MLTERRVRPRCAFFREKNPESLTLCLGCLLHPENFLASSPDLEKFSLFFNPTLVSRGTLTWSCPCPGETFFQKRGECSAIQNLGVDLQILGKGSPLFVRIAGCSQQEDRGEGAVGMRTSPAVRFRRQDRLLILPLGIGERHRTDGRAMSEQCARKEEKRVMERGNQTIRYRRGAFRT